MLYISIQIHPKGLDASSVVLLRLFCSFMSEQLPFNWRIAVHVHIHQILEVHSIRDVLKIIGQEQESWHGCYLAIFYKSILSSVTEWNCQK